MKIVTQKLKREKPGRAPASPAAGQGQAAIGTLDFADYRETAASQAGLQAKMDTRQPYSTRETIQAIQPKENETGLPDRLKSGIESLSGLSMDNVHVHYNSARPARLSALAYTQGADIHVGPGQERHLPHEAWHAVQQKQGRVQPTIQAKGGTAINNDDGLEREANRMGERAFRQTQLRRSGSGAQAPQAFSVHHSKAQQERSASARRTSARGITDDGEGALAPLISANPRLSTQARVIDKVRNSPQQKMSIFTGTAPVQMLMTRAAFVEQRQAVGAQNARLATIGDQLHTFAGLNNGNDADYQLRLQALRALDTEIHNWLTTFVQYKINDATNGALMRTLLDESAAAHREIITAVAANDQLLPIDTTGIEAGERVTILALWRAIVGGTGNLRITERDNAPGFRNRMLASIAQILQGANGRRMMTEINRGGDQAAQRIILSSSFTAELQDTQTAEAAKNEAIPLSGLNNNDKAYELQYMAPEAAAQVQADQISIYAGDANDQQAFTRFLMENALPYVRYRGVLYHIGQGTGSYVRIQTPGSSILSGETDQEVFTPEFVTVAHELGHANRMRKGAVIPSTLRLDEMGVPAGPDRDLWTNSEELVNIKGTENAIRNEHGISRRKYHSGSPSGVRNVKTHHILDQRVLAAMHGIDGNAAGIAVTHFPDFQAWQNMPYSPPAPDFSNPAVVETWTPKVQNIEIFGPAYAALVRGNLIPELMHEDARPMLQRVMDEDAEFRALRLQFNQLMTKNDGTVFARDARAIGQAAKGRMLSLDLQAARRSDVLFEDVDFDIKF